MENYSIFILYLERRQDHKNKNLQHNLISDYLPTNIVGIEENFEEKNKTQNS